MASLCVSVNLTMKNLPALERLIFRLRRMHEMQAIVTDVCSVCPSVCHTAEFGGTCSVLGHLVQTLQNYFGLLLV